MQHCCFEGHTHTVSKHGAKNPNYLQNVEHLAHSWPWLQRQGCSEICWVTYTFLTVPDFSISGSQSYRNSLDFEALIFYNIHQGRKHGVTATKP